MGTIVPVRDPEREKLSVGHGPVTTYMLKPEELEAYRAGKGWKPPTNKNGSPIRQAVENKSVRPAAPEVAGAKTDRRRKAGPDKIMVLRKLVKGMTIKEIERGLGMSLNSLGYWIRKWGFSGLTPKAARELLKQMEGKDHGDQ